MVNFHQLPILDRLSKVTSPMYLQFKWKWNNLPANLMEMASAYQLGRHPMEMAQPTCQPDGNGLCLSRELALIAPAPSSLPAFHCHLKGSDYTLCTVQYNAHYPNRLHWLNCSAVQSKAATSRHFANKEREQITSSGQKDRQHHLFLELEFLMSFS